jgi:3-phosphoshikimate 1-carboxyvinyltransferase
MNVLTVRSGRPLRGMVGVPGDKSITHRALLLGGLADGPTYIRGALLEGDCRSTMGCLQALGVSVEGADSAALRPTAAISVIGRGLRGLRPPAGPVDCVRSGTTMRLLAGILAGQSFSSTLTGHPQLLARPMRRVVAPLQLMGAQIEDTDGRAPLHIVGGRLHGIDYTPPVASAQVKSAILLAGLYAEGNTTVHEPVASRDHTERMLRAMGAAIYTKDGTIQISPAGLLWPIDITVPGDISSAAFLLVAGTIVPGSEIIIRNVGLNPTRTGILDALLSMGADITVLDQRQAGEEPVGDLRVRHSTLRAIEVGGPMIPRLIDELPVLAVAATQAEGVTVIRDAAELRVKETDRIEGIAEPLRRLGANIQPQPDGMLIEGLCRLKGAMVSSRDDHRLAMSLLVAGLIAAGETGVDGVDFISDSYPGFVDTLRLLGGEL